MDGKPLILFVTSSMQYEGKTTLSGSIAIAVSEFQKTLAMDCDFRNPSLHKFFGIDGGAGIIQIVSDESTTQEVVTRNSESLHLLSCGGAIAAPSKILHSERFSSLLDSLMEEYPVIIMDMPPVLLTPDVFAMNHPAAKGIMIVHGGSTRRHLFVKALKSLKVFNIDLIGVVMNKMPANSGPGHYSNYYFPYSEYSGKKKYGNGNNIRRTPVRSGKASGRNYGNGPSKV